MAVKRRRIWIGLALAAALCGVLVADRILSRVATRIVNRKLPELVGTESSVERISFGLLRGSILVRDLKIANPAGFDQGDALSVPRMRINLNLFSLRGKPWVVDEIRIEEARVRLQRDRARRMNLKVLLAHALSGEKEQKESHRKRGAGDKPLPGASNGAAKAQVPGKDKGLPETRPPEDGGPIELQVKRLSITDLHFVYTDAAIRLGKKLTGVDIEADGLAYGPARSGEPVLPARIALTGRLDQEPFPGAWVGLYARMGVIAQGVPPLNASLQLADLELSPLASLVPASASRVLGCDALDLSAEGAVAQDLLRVLVRLETCGGNAFSLRIGGTPRRPLYDTRDLVFKILQNAAANFVGGVSDPRLLADTAARTGSTLGRGVAGMLETAASGLLKTTRGLAKGDLGTAADGIGTATAGALEEGAGAVAGAAKGVAEGAGRAGAGSGASVRHWRQKAQERWEAAWRQARERVDRMPYPGP